MARKLLLWSGWYGGVLIDKHTDGSSKSWLLVPKVEFVEKVG